MIFLPTRFLFTLTDTRETFGVLKASAAFRSRGTGCDLFSLEGDGGGEISEDKAEKYTQGTPRITNCEMSNSGGRGASLPLWWFL